MTEISKPISYRSETLYPTQMYGKRRGRQTKFAPSSKEVSMREGALPAVNPYLLKCIEGYMRGEKEADFVNRENYREVLQAVKVVDLDLDRHPGLRKEYVRSSFAVRELCLGLSRGQMLSYEAFTKSIDPKNYDASSQQSRNYAAQLENYVPERISQFAKASAKFVIDAMGMSRRLESGRPTIFVLRGNCGAGKRMPQNIIHSLRKGWMIMESRQVRSL